MELRYCINEFTGLPHIYDHGVSEEEVEWIIANAEFEWHGNGDSIVAIGRTPGRKLLKVIYVPDEDNEGAFVITSYRPTRKEVLAHNRRMRSGRK
ncbi:MAG TPA: hypothetical protein VKX17_10410 [Planctomycetota bacterium]|nr:hypothetical protein [Planctomycetota bacterium]